MEETKKENESIETTHCQLFLNKKFMEQLRVYTKICNTSLSSTIERFFNQDEFLIELNERIRILQKKIDNGWDALIPLVEEEKE